MLLAVSATFDGERADLSDRSSGTLGICLLPAYLPGPPPPDASVPFATA